MGKSLSRGRRHPLVPMFQPMVKSLNLLYPRNPLNRLNPLAIVLWLSR